MTGSIQTGVSGGSVELYWLPLGAGGHSVKHNGRVYETCSAARQHRTRCDLYHAALELHMSDASFVIELAPALPPDLSAARGVAVEGAVGSRFLGGLLMFRYQLRCWRGGEIPDKAEAVASPVVLATTETAARSILSLAPSVPAYVWGRDELRTGDMWNSNSAVSWLLEQSGLGANVPLPRRGRAPGWHAGIVAARQFPIRAASPTNLG